MKITIEHEQINATTISLVVAQRLLETIKELEKTTMPLGKPNVIIPVEKTIAKKEPDIFDTKDTSDIPPEVIKPKMPSFDPAWCEKKLDFKKTKLVRYSNPCSTLKGKCGTKCWQTELIIDNNGEWSTCDCEFYDVDELHRILDEIVSCTNLNVSKPKLPCSLEKLKSIAELVNQGCTNAQVCDCLGIKPTSLYVYKNACRRMDLLN